MFSTKVFSLAVSILFILPLLRLRCHIRSTFPARTFAPSRRISSKQALLYPDLIFGHPLDLKQQLSDLERHGQTGTCELQRPTDDQRSGHIRHAISCTA